MSVLTLILGKMKTVVKLVIKFLSFCYNKNEALFGRFCYCIDTSPSWNTTHKNIVKETAHMFFCWMIRISNKLKIKPQ
jgi:hypothetical protein